MLSKLTIQAFFLLSGILGAAEIDAQFKPGGIMPGFFNGTETYKKEMSSRSSSGNLMDVKQAGYHSVFGINRGSIQWNDDWAKKEAEMQKLVSGGAKEIDGVPFYWVETPVEVSKYLDATGMPILWNRIMPSQNLKVRHGGKYLITFKAKGQAFQAPGHNRFVVFIDSYGVNRKPSAGLFSHVLDHRPAVTGESVSFIASPDTDNIRIHFGQEGCGHLEVGDIKVVEQVASDYDVMLYPEASMDNTFCISRGQYGHLCFGQQIESGILPAHPKMKLTLPAGFKLIATGTWTPSRGMTETGNTDGSTTFVIPVTVYQWEHLAIKEHSMTFPVLAMVTTDLSVSDNGYAATYQAIADNYEGKVKTFTLKVMDPVFGKRPKYFRTGVYDYRILDTGDNTFPLFAEWYAKMGFNCFYTFNWRKTTSEVMKKLDIWRLGSGIFQNGYYFNGPAADKRPDYTWYRGMDGKPANDRAICPNAVSQHTVYYQNEVVAPMQKQIAVPDGVDYLMSNWEPSGIMTGGGCFCDRCKADFIAFTKLPKADVDAVWPDKVINKYRSEWFKFKSCQHMRFLAAYENDLRAASRRNGAKEEAGFMPMITRDIMLDSEFNLAGESAFAVHNYADKLRWINPWGPYLGYHWKLQKMPEAGDRIRMLTAVRSVNRYLDIVCGNSMNRPKILGFPLGLSIGMTVSPEALKMDTLSIFVGGWQGSTPYYFPSGYDCRWWKALADSNTLMADTERFVIEGKRAEDKFKALVKPLTPFPSPLFFEFNEPDKLISSLQAETFTGGEDTLFAVANFWQRAEVFFELKYAALNPEKSYSVRNLDDNIRYGAFSGREIANGITLHLGGLRWGFFVVSPVKDKTDKTGFPQEEVKKLMLRRLPAIQKAYTDELAYQKNTMAPVEAAPDYSALKPISNDGVSFSSEQVKKKKKEGLLVNAYSMASSTTDIPETSLIVKGGKSTWRVVLTSGAFIRDWTLADGTQLCVSFPRWDLPDGPWFRRSLQEPDEHRKNRKDPRRSCNRP